MSQNVGVEDAVIKKHGKIVIVNVRKCLNMIGWQNIDLKVIRSRL